MRALGVFTVLALVVVTFTFSVNPHWKKSSHGLAAFIAVVAVVAVVGVSAAVISWHRRRASKRFW